MGFCVCTSAAPQRPAHSTVSSQVATHLRTDRVCCVLGRSWIWTQDCWFAVRCATTEPPLLSKSHLSSPWATSPLQEPPLLSLSHLSSPRATSPLQWATSPLQWATSPFQCSYTSPLLYVDTLQKQVKAEGKGWQYYSDPPLRSTRSNISFNSIFKKKLLWVFSYRRTRPMLFLMETREMINLVTQRSH